MKQKMPASPESSVPNNGFSLAEILLIATYFIAVIVIPEKWVETAVGKMAFAAAACVNPYLSGYSTAFAEDTRYFIHCHVLATWILTPALMWFAIRRNGGFRAYEKLFMKSVSELSLAGMWLLYLVFVLALVAMLWMVDYPLTRSELSIWVRPFGVCSSAFLFASLLSICCYGLYFTLKATFIQIFRGPQK
ncbi:MAG: hypothetical protein JWM42_2907 [Burkholderia sp.]|nr:hypothetical protein [Burkholderia sp.]